MSLSPLQRRIRIALLAGFALFWVQAALADTTISTSNFAYGGASSYTVPTGCNYVSIQAWGAQGYVSASYAVTPGTTCSLKLVGGNGGNTMVTLPTGTIHIAGGPGICTADGSCENVTTLADGSGPTSPGIGNKYIGYITITAIARPPTITSATTATGCLGSPCSYTITSTGGATSYGATGLPSGLTINTATGVISGTPKSAGNFTVTLSASNGAVATQTLALTITPVISSALTASAKQNEAFSYTVAASGVPTGFSATGLPPGLTINWTTGVISGSPTQSGTFDVQIGATASGATGSATLVLTVAATYQLTIALSNSQGGTATGAGVYDPGTTVSIAELANTGFRTAGWGGTSAGSVANAGSASSSIVMNSNCSLIAEYVAVGTLTVNAASIGGVAGGVVTGGGTFDVGSVQSITAASSGSNVFTGWAGTGISNANAADTTITITGNETITAGFSFEEPNVLGSVLFPNAVSAGQTGIPSTTATMQVVLSNTGSSNETISSLTISSLTTTGDFQPTVTLPLTIPPGGTADITVTFDPTLLGERTGVLTAITNSTTTPVIQYDLQGYGVNPNSPPSATITSPLTAYTLSPLTVSSTAMAPNNNLTLHSIEWLSPSGSWTVSSVGASGGNDDRQLGITFPTTGVWTLRAGASVDNGVTWYYSANVQVNVSNGLTSYTLETMAVPSAGMTNWYAPSPVVQQTYQVQHTNP